MKLKTEVNKPVSLLYEEEYLLLQNREKIISSLKEVPVLFDPEQAQQTFKEAGVFFQGQIKKDFEQLIDFNKKITDERRSYLQEELCEIENKLKKINLALDAVSKQPGEKTMTARRYAEHFRKAEASLHTYNYLLSNNFVIPKCIKLFEPNDFLIGAVEHSIASIESFINHLGFIFIDSWSGLERMNFWKQYKKVIETLKNLGISVDHIVEEPFNKFEEYRESIRNEHHHVKSSKHDANIIKRNEALEFKEDCEESYNMMNCWIKITEEIATNACNKTKQFIEYFQNEFQSKYFCSYSMAEILKRNDLIKLSSDDIRCDLLRRYINDPLNPLVLVSGEYSLKYK